jgi:hypothetical protein
VKYFSYRGLSRITAEADLAVPCGAEMGEGFGTGSCVTFLEIGFDSV